MIFLEIKRTLNSISLISFSWLVLNRFIIQSSKSKQSLKNCVRLILPCKIGRFQAPKKAKISLFEVMKLIFDQYWNEAQMDYLDFGLCVLISCTPFFELSPFFDQMHRNSFDSNSSTSNSLSLPFVEDAASSSSSNGDRSDPIKLGTSFSHESATNTVKYTSPPPTYSPTTHLDFQVVIVDIYYLLGI